MSEASKDLQDKKTKKKKSSKTADGKAKNGKEVAKEAEDNKSQEAVQEDEKVAQSETTNGDLKSETTNGSGEPSDQKPENIEDNEIASDVKTADYTPKEMARDETKVQSHKNPPILDTPAKEEKDVIRPMDIRKLSELKEAFNLFDINHDGILDLEDLKYTFATLGKPDIPEEQLQQMLDEMPGPVDFDAFVILFGHKFTELDPESVFTEALATWDVEGKGYISEERMKDDLRRFGDRFTPTDIDRALEEAPVYVQEGRPMIDYLQFSSNVCGLRNVEKTRQFQKTVESGET